jgi:hypothetical protein
MLRTGSLIDCPGVKLAMFRGLCSQQTLNLVRWVYEDGIAVSRHGFEDQARRIATPNAVLFVEIKDEYSI